MPAWAIGVANADKESVKQYFICFNNSFVSLVNIRHGKVTEPTLTSFNERPMLAGFVVSLSSRVSSTDLLSTSGNRGRFFRPGVFFEETAAEFPNLFG
jgi:hypothetical protein